VSEYADIAALNWSSLKHMAESPLAYKWHLAHPREDTPSLKLGRAVHALLLEPDSYAARRTGKLTPAAAAKVEHCAAAVAEHRAAMVALDETEREVVIQWVDGPTGLRCKGRVDAIRPDRLVDLKTTRDLGAFSRSASGYLYHGQMAWYHEGACEAGVLRASADVLVVAVETSPPFDVGVFQISTEVLGEGWALVRRLLGELLICQRSDEWPGKYPEPVPLELSRWAAREEEW